MSRVWEPSAGGIVMDHAGRLLLIRRARPPSEGRWSIPGGRCRPGESTAAACVREVAEETGLAVHIVRRAGRVKRAGPNGVGYDIEDFVCSVDGGELRAGDDASEARWVSHAELASLDLVPGLLDALASWDALPS
ncbi:MAG TPA: NUDIX domain-containing protein [Jatrophihabitantaceae bacterium]|nr:NUDIX domain-containing protein [Jatrophihabitantaceae bacterium]